MASFKQSRTVGRVTEITHIVPFKKGEPEGAPGLRYADRCRIVLEAFGKLEKEGFVSPVRRFAGIHFARWTLIDADTRLLFTTNFDGTWEDYIGDFTRRIPWSLGLIWCNCVDYPEDLPGAGPDDAWAGGAENFPLFSKFVKQYQVDAGLFYSHYGHLTVRDIRYLQVFHEEANKMLEDGAGDLGALNQNAMRRAAAIEEAYEGLPDGPFPTDHCTIPMPSARKAIYKARIETPIRALYPQYNEATLDDIMSEFGLGSRTKPKRW